MSVTKLPDRPSIELEKNRAEPDEYRYAIMAATTRTFKAVQVGVMAIEAILVLFTGLGWAATTLLMIWLTTWLIISTISAIKTWADSEDSYQQPTDYSLYDPADRKYKLSVMVYSWPAFVARYAISRKHWDELKLHAHVDDSDPVGAELREAKRKLKQLNALPGHVEEVQIAKQQAAQTIKRLEDVTAQIVEDQARIVAGNVFVQMRDAEHLALQMSKTQEELMNAYHNPMLAITMHGGEDYTPQARERALEELKEATKPQVEVIKPEVM